MALATRPSMPGWLASRTRRTSENWAWCADNLRVAPGDSLGGLDGLLRVVGLLALAVGVHHDDAYRGAEGAVAAVGLDVLAARAPAAATTAAAAVVATVPAAPGPPAASPPPPAAPAAAVAAPAPAAPAPVVVAVAGVDDRLDVAHGSGGEPHPRGEDRVARLVALGLFGAHGGPFHGLAVVAALGLERLAHRVGPADALDRRHEARLGAGGAARGRGGRLRLLGRLRRGLDLGLRLGLDGGLALGDGRSGLVGRRRRCVGGPRRVVGDLGAGALERGLLGLAELGELGEERAAVALGRGQAAAARPLLARA